jgi:hypothetical protein
VKAEVTGQLGIDTSSGGSHSSSAGSRAGAARPNRRLTKVNRCMAEGRKAFLERFAAIYGGAG